MLFLLDNLHEGIGNRNTTFGNKRPANPQGPVMDPVMDPIPSLQTFHVLLAAASGMSWDPTPARAVLHPICTYVQPGRTSCFFIRPEHLFIRPDHVPGANKAIDRGCGVILVFASSLKIFIGCCLESENISYLMTGIAGNSGF